MVWVAVGVGIALVLGVAIWLVLRSRSSRGPFSIVVLRRTPATIDEAAIRGAVRRVFKIDARVIPVEVPGSLTSAYLIVHEDLPRMGFVNSTRTYTEPDQYQGDISFEDVKVHEALRSHTAWISLDAMEKVPRKLRADVYSVMGMLVAEFIDDDSLLLYQPAENRFEHVTEESTRALILGKAGALFGDEELNAPMFDVGEQDAAINNAIAEAQRRLPEFLGEIERRGLACEPLFKAKFANAEGETEVMWVQLSNVESNALKGKVVNKPRARGLPKRDEEVTVAIDDIVDWAYLDEKEEPQGLFVDRILMGKK